MPFDLPWLSPRTPGLRVWAVEPYFGGSHQAFLAGLRERSAHRFDLHTLPGRHWKWRMHGAAFSLAEQARRSLDEGVPQVLFASDMLDTATYRSLAPRALADVPLIVYFHENQLTYPLPPGVERDLGYAMKNLASAATADRVLFNSDFHRRDFLSALDTLLPLLPDERPERQVAAVAAKAEVLRLGVDLARFDTHRPSGDARDSGRWGPASRGPLLVWNHRWEYDKDPGAFFDGLYQLQQRGVPFRVALAGANQGLPSRVFVEASRRLADHIVQWGRLPTFADYASLLWEADIVVSTALHEFFGTAVVEAVYCGCRPVLPARLAYPELLPAEAHADVLYGEGELVPALLRALEEGTPWSEEWQRTWVSPYDWKVMARKYDEVLWSCWERGRNGGQGPG